MNRRDRELAAQAKFDAVMAVRRDLAERNQHMKDLRKAEWTYEAIGKIYGLSRQRVYQIVKEETSHLVRPVRPTHIPRDYKKHNGKIPHGSITGYTYGCRGKSECPAKPTCLERRREYMRQWYQKKRERKAFGF